MTITKQQMDAAAIEQREAWLKNEQELDQLFQQAMEHSYEASERERISDYCQMVDEMPRRGLLVALGWDGAKANTARLRKIAKDHVRANDPHFDIWCGYHAAKGG